jgi:polyhydroxybutyrate depolymerase
LLALAGCLTQFPELDEPCAVPPDPGLYKLKLDESGRSVLVDLPDTEGPRPTFVVLHGFGSSASRFKDVTGYSRVGRDEGFMAVFADGKGSGLGLNRSWNGGECCPPASTRDFEDVAFLEEVIQTLERRACADPERTYVSGFSNGGMMALRAACQSELVDGVVSAAGTLLVDECTATPKPVFLAHGLQDETVLFEGGVSDVGNVEYPSSDETLATFLERNECAPEPQIVQVGGARCEEYDCAVPVRRCTLEAWDHRWPGGIHTERADFNLTRQSWNFFDGVPLEESIP